MRARRQRVLWWFVALGALLASAAGGLIVASIGAGSTAPVVDIEIAIDTTSSMGPSIAQAQRDAKQLVGDVRARYPGAHVAVVQFRDRGDTVEYAVVRPMTGDGAQIDAAIDSLSPAGGGDMPEALNLVFSRSVDPAIGWRAAARKLVVVISDAEPHGAGSAGFKGCTDTSADPFGLKTASSLAAMRAAKRTLILVRQAASARVTLECYRSLAAAGYVGGSAQNGGTKLISVIESLISKAVTTPTTTKPTGTKAIKRIRFTFKAYANNVRVGPPLVGRFQLGVARVYGSGVINRSGAVIGGGAVRDTDRPNPFTRPVRSAGAWLHVVSGRRLVVGSFTRLELVVRVVGTETPSSCPIGTRGLLVLTDDDHRMANGERADSVGTIFPRAGGPLRAPDGGAACRGHHQGYSNQDNRNTNPTKGGPPDGGQWAVVEISW